MAANEDQESTTMPINNGEQQIESPAKNDDIPVKFEPFESWKFRSEEHINLLSDDEGDTVMGGTFPTQGTPFKPRAKDLSTNRAVAAGHISENGSAIEETNGELTAQEAVFDREKIRKALLEKQRQMADKFRARQRIDAVATDSDSLTNDDNDVQQSTPLSRGLDKRGKNARVDAAAARFERLKQQYQKKKAADSLSIEEEIEFIKAESAESARLRKLEADEEYDRFPSDKDDDDDSDGLFVAEGAAIPSYSALHSDNDEEEQDDEPKKQKKRGRNGPIEANSKNEKPRKRKTPKNSAKKDQKVPGTCYMEDDVDKVLAIGKSQHSAKARPKKSNAKKATTERKRAGPSMTNVGSIWGTDVFEDAAKTAGLAEQPTFEFTTLRKDAMKQLIASVPEENLKVAKSDQKYLDDAIKAFNGRASVKAAENGNWLVTGMRTPLKHYQVLGTAFMLKRENGDYLPKGGILADQMGLGKTITMLGLITNGKAKEKSKTKTTLIVASPALVGQWYEEIRMHCLGRRENKHGIGRVMQYRSGSRVKSNDLDSMIEESDIVLTTYQEVCKSYPKAVIPINLQTAKEKDDWWKQYYDTNRGLLHRIKFYRLVLDEAQAIKNHRSHTAMACRALDYKHPWAITGTPVLNSVKEFYSYFKFLREPHTGSYKVFKGNFCSPEDPDGTEKLNVFLRKIMIRRTHLDTLFNARLLDLPQPKEQTLWLNFNTIERRIYELVKKRFIQRINDFSKQNGLEKQYNHIWSMILRLRQICGHVLLVQGTVCDLLEREDFEELNKITESENEVSDEGAALLLHLRSTLKSNTGMKTIEGSLGSAIITENEVLHTGVLDIGNTDGDTGGKHGLNFRFRKYMESLIQSQHWTSITQRTRCCGCRQAPHEPYVTSCFHIYCHGCLEDLQHLAARQGRDQARCSECGEAYDNSGPCEGFDTFQVRTTSTSTTNGQPTKKSSKGKKNESEMEDWISLPGEVCPSAKTQAVKAQVLNWFQEDPNVKIIIYSQFLDMLRILGRICQGEQWEYLEYSGKLNHEQRDKVLKEFKEDPKKRILLASLKCGGLGLNLTMASKVICIDPWWNSAVENQAFCRVFRIGQERSTSLTRILVNNTIDAAMMAMKERKQMEIDEVMDGAGRKDDLTVRDLMRLFGNVGEDDEGRPFIFASQDDMEPEHLRLVNTDDEDEDQFMGNEA